MDWFADANEKLPNKNWTQDFHILILCLSQGWLEHYNTT